MRLAGRFYDGLLYESLIKRWHELLTIKTERSKERNNGENKLEKKEKKKEKKDRQTEKRTTKDRKTDIQKEKKYEINE